MNACQATPDLSKPELNQWVTCVYPVDANPQPVKLDRMSRWLPTLLLALWLPAFAAPSAGDDDVGRLLAERGILGRIEQVGLTVKDRASDLVINAMGSLGVPYRRGGVSEDTGFDCSGFVRAIYEQTVGMVLPRRAKEQAAATEVIDQKDLKPGDLVFFNTMRRAFSHVGIYVGDGKFIHAPKPGAEVRVEDMAGSYWARRFDGARRVSGVTDAPALEAAMEVAGKLRVQIEALLSMGLPNSPMAGCRYSTCRTAAWQKISCMWRGWCRCLPATAPCGRSFLWVLRTQNAGGI